MEKSLGFFWGGLRQLNQKYVKKNIITNVLRLFLVCKSTIRKRLIKTICENDKKHKYLVLLSSII